MPVRADDQVKPTIVVLAHGSGSHMEHKTIEWLAGILRECGVSVVRFNFLYRAHGKSLPDKMPLLIETFRAVTSSVRERLAPERLIVGGHSMGGRVATMMEAESQSSDGLLLFGYPLHPPGKEHKLRDAHLAAIRTPTLQLNGSDDTLCVPEIMERIVAGLDPKVWQLTWIEGADHSYAVKRSSGRTREDAESDIRGAVSSWLDSAIVCSSNP